MNTTLIIAAFLLIMCIVLIIMFATLKKQLQKNEEKLEKLSGLQELTKMQSAQISDLQKQSEGYAKLRHDYKHQLLVLQEFAKEGNKELLEEYLPELDLKKSVVKLPICENVIINTIVQSYKDKMQALGINFDVKIQADEKLWLSPSDISILFGNLLDNAITAVNEGKNAKKIRLRTIHTEEYFSIAMGNSFGKPRNQKDGKFYSTKEKHKGIGLESINSIALKYDGKTKFEVKDNLFMSYCVFFHKEEIL